MRIRAAPESYWVHLRLASAYGLKGETNRAAVEIASPTDEPSWGDLSIAGLKAAADENQCPFETTYFAGLLKAGMPEQRTCPVSPAQFQHI